MPITSADLTDRLKRADRAAWLSAARPSISRVSAPSSGRYSRYAMPLDLDDPTAIALAIFRALSDRRIEAALYGGLALAIGHVTVAEIGAVTTQPLLRRPWDRGVRWSREAGLV